MLSIDENDDTAMYVDGVHVACDDSKGHSGLFLAMGQGATTSVSKKLGLVAVSSAEIEIIADDERFPKCVWFRHFRLAQGDSDKEDVLTQDNASRVLLRKNHPFSVEKGSKHMNVRCFFVVDKLEKKEVKIVHCPSDKMVADFSSKPLQGSLFRHHRNAMQGIVDNDFVLQK